MLKRETFLAQNSTTSRICVFFRAHTPYFLTLKSLGGFFEFWKWQILEIFLLLFKIFDLEVIFGDFTIHSKMYQMFRNNWKFLMQIEVHKCKNNNK